MSFSGCSRKIIWWTPSLQKMRNTKAFFRHEKGLLHSLKQRIHSINPVVYCHADFALLFSARIYAEINKKALVRFIPTAASGRPPKTDQTRHPRARVLSFYFNRLEHSGERGSPSDLRDNSR